MPLSVTVKTSRTLPRAAFSQVASSRTLPRSVNFTALSIRFSSAARSRSGSPITAAGRSLAISASSVEPLGLGARGERSCERIGEPPRPDQLSPQHEPLGVGAGGVDDQRGQHREVLGRALDRVRPAALALAELGGGQQLAQRQDAGQRRADLMREVGERRLDGLRMRRGRPPAHRALGAAPPLARGCPRSRHRTPTGRLPRREAAPDRQVT